MIKKMIILMSIASLSFWNIFAYNLWYIKKLYNNKLNILEHKIELKYNNDNSKICYYKKAKYKTIDNVLNLYETKYPKYSTIFKIFLEVNNYREVNINNNCDRLKLQEKLKQISNTNNNSSSQNNTTHTITKNETNNNNYNSKNTSKKLSSKLWNINYDYNWNIKINTTHNSINIPAIWKIQKIYNNFTIKVNNHWIGCKKMLIIKVSGDNLQYGIDYAKKYYNKNYIFYKKITDEYKIYLIDKKDINIIDPFDPSQSYEYNITQLQEAWYLYIKKFLYKKINKDNIVLSWLFKFNNKLYFMVTPWTWQYYKIPNNKFFTYIKSIEKWSIITKLDNNNLMARKDGIKLFYLWDFQIYKNIDLERFWKIIGFTFYIIWKYNLPYNIQNMYDLINFAKQFEWKTLKDIYTRIILNFKYNKRVNNILNEKWMNQKLINDKVNADRKLIQNWDIFYALSHKEWVCQSISDIFSMIALFYWKDADVVRGTSKDWYLHQISKIEYKYYDPTFDLEDNWTRNITHFGITKQQVEKYLNLKSK